MSASCRGMLLGALSGFLKEVRDRSRPKNDVVTIRVHQFGHTLLYAPFYMAVEQLLLDCNSKGDGTQDSGAWLKLEYVNAGTDEAAQAAVVGAGPWMRGAEPIIHLGLSGVGDRDADHGVADRLVEKPIVNRLPLWGVALANNLKIAQLKYRYAGPEATPASRQFLQSFSGKLSLLQPQNGDLETATRGDPISISLYGESTGHRLFRQYLNDNGQGESVSRLQPVHGGFEREFDLLLSSSVDVALTVQPWRLFRSVLGKQLNVEIVYTHLGRPEPVTSIYVCKDPHDEPGAWDSFLAVLAALMQENVGLLYDGKKREIKEAYDAYERSAKRVVRSQGSGDEANGHDTSGTAAVPEDLVEFGYAICLLNDSQVYYNDVLSDAKGMIARARRLRHDLEGRIQRYFDKERDIAYRCSVEAELLHRRGGDWHSSRSLSDHGCQNIYRAFRKFADHLNLEAGLPTQVSDVREQWCLRDPNRLLEGVYSRAGDVERLSERPWQVRISSNGKVDKSDRGVGKQVDFSPWIHEEAVEKALMHLNSQFEKGDLRLRHIAADVLPLSDDVGISWLWIEYDRDSSTDAFASHFFRDPMARAILNGWYVNGKSEKLSSHHIFQREGHGTLSFDGARPTFRYDGEDQLAFFPVDRMTGSEALLLTFRVAGVLYSRHFS